MSKLNYSVDQIEVNVNKTSNITGEGDSTSYPSTKGVVDYVKNVYQDYQDYVVQQGSYDIWTYRKWNSGISECWGKYRFSDKTTDSTWGGYNTVGLGKVNYPSNLFIEPPLTNYSLKVANFPGHLFIDSEESATETAYMSLAGHDKRTVSGSVQLYVIGKWK